MFVPFLDGNYLFFRASTEKTVEDIRRLSPHDAEAYHRFLAAVDRASEILNPILLEEPTSIADLAGRFRGKDEEIYRYLMFGNLYDMLADYFVFFQAEDGIRDLTVTGVQTCALPI